MKMSSSMIFMSRTLEKIKFLGILKDLKYELETIQFLNPKFLLYTI